jgi:hypothetical protein
MPLPERWLGQRLSMAGLGQGVQDGGARSKTDILPAAYVGLVPMKISEIIRLLEQDGWVLKRTTGSHRHFSHPAKPGLVTRRR